MMLNISIPFDFFQIVYLKTDVEQKPFMVIGVKYCADGGLLIELQSERSCSWHYLGEISEEKNALITV